MSPNVNDLKSSKFLTKHDVEPDVLVTIKGYEELNVAMENQAPEIKWCLLFNELDKPLVLNMTNGMLLSAITGSEDFDHWLGKQIVLYNDKTVMFAGKLTGGIRIRASKGGQTNPEYSGIPDPDPSITEDMNTHEEAKAAHESKFCAKCGRPLSENCACDDVPF